MQPQSDRLKTSRIVVVNDDSTQLATLVGILEKRGFAVQGYAGAEQALRAMQDQAQPDLIITDLHMPGIDGWRFCRLLRSSEFKALNDVPIIVVSATFSGDETALVTAELGASAFLSAPVDADELIDAVRKALRGERVAKLPRVLLVDDSRSLANALREVFESNAYTVDVALTGQDALEAFKAKHYDLAVLDYHLPDIMGNALLKAFVLQRPETICVMITTNTQPKLALEWMQSGAAAYVRKPFDPEYLVKVCEGARRERSQLRIKDLLEQRTRELRKSESRYRRLINNLPDIVYIYSDLRGGVFWSPSVESVLGYTVEQLQANPFLWNESIHPEDKEKVTMAIIESSQGKPFEIEYRIQDSRGDWLWLHDRSTASITRDGETMVEGIATDITDRKRAEEALMDERLRMFNIIKGTNVGTWEWNVQKGETVFNERWAEIIGYTLDELAPVSIETWAKHTHPDDLKVSMDLLERHFSGDLDYYECEARMKHKSGGWIWVLDRGRVFTWTEDGKPLWMFGTHLDITDRKLAEEKIRSINAQLQKANAEKDMLFSIIAHDLKSPVSGLVGSTAILSREFDLLSQRDARLLWDGLHKSATNIAALLDDLLQWSLMSQGGMDFAPAPSSLKELTDASLATAQDVAKSKEIRIRGDIPHDVSVLADQPMINTVIRNVVFNAIKFTPRGGEIVITARQEGGNVTMAIQDNGTGMDEQTLATIFSLVNKKRRLGTEGEKGTGLGLILCRQFIEKHGGQIWLESKPGQGTTVFFTLPTQETRTPQTAEPLNLPTFPPFTLFHLMDPIMPKSHPASNEPGPVPGVDLQDIFDNAPIGIFISTPEGRYISANLATARMLGYDTQQELIESVTDIAAFPWRKSFISLKPTYPPHGATIRWSSSATASPYFIATSPSVKRWRRNRSARRPCSPRCWTPSLTSFSSRISKEYILDATPNFPGMLESAKGISSGEPIMTCIPKKMQVSSGSTTNS